VSRKLSDNQRRALEILRKGAPWPSAYDLGVGLGTLNSLEGRGLVMAHHGLGSLFSPHTAIKWSITEAGRAALTERSTEPQKDVS